LADRLYPHDEDRDSNVIEVLLGRLRRKLDPDGSLAPIETLRGRGYRLALDKRGRNTGTDLMSLRARVVASAAAVLAVFILLTSLALEQAFRDTAESSREERLLAQIFSSWPRRRPKTTPWSFPDALAEARFSLPESGLYARVFDAADDLVWESESAIGVPEPAPCP
jgi:hypothetical protein